MKTFETDRKSLGVRARFEETPLYMFVIFCEMKANRETPGILGSAPGLGCKQRTQDVSDDVCNDAGDDVITYDRYYVTYSEYTETSNNWARAVCG